MAVRPFDRERDLAGVLDLVGRSRARGDTGAIFHPGDLQWWLRRVGRAEMHVGVLIVDAAPVGLVSAGMRRRRLIRDYRLALA